MIKTKIIERPLNDEVIQRVQIVEFDSFDKLNFVFPEYLEDSFASLCNIYTNLMIKKYPFLFGQIIIFRLSKDYLLPNLKIDKKYGSVYYPLQKLSIYFKENLYCKDGDIFFKNDVVKKIYLDLKESGNLIHLKGWSKKIQLMPFSDNLGLLSNNNSAKFRVNANFFSWDQKDIDSVYDEVSCPLGLCLKDGVIINPPSFSREALLIDKNNRVCIRPVTIHEVDIIIDGVKYHHGINCKIYERPKQIYGPNKGFNIVVRNNKILASAYNQRLRIPSNGFIINLENRIEIKNNSVLYDGLNEYKFAIQVGNSVMINGEKTLNFKSRFYNFLNPFATSFPPSMYPLNFKGSRAPRIVLGTNKNNRPVVLFFEGRPKFNYCKGKDSEGVSLLEEALVLEKFGVYNAINLDGGGSAQVLIDNKRSLQVSDRDSKTFKEIERAVAIGLEVDTF